MNKNKSKKSGGLLIEILVAVAIITVSILSATAVAQKSVAVSRQSTHHVQAAFLLEEGAEIIRILRDNGWSNIANLTNGTEYYPVFSGGTWTLSTTPNLIDAFTRKIVFSAVSRDASSGDIVSSGGVVDIGTRMAIVTVSWNEGAQNLNKSLSLYITDLF